jgi:sterol desaturase/sphingolipid hydroxylase (fatty acid hydroxylase superfamily)
MGLFLLMLGGVVVSAIALYGSMAAFRSSWTEGRRIRPERNRKLGGRKYVRKVAINSAMSPIVIFGTAFLAYDAMFYEAEFSFWRMLLEVVGVLMLYDFLYYLAHRFLFHDGPMHRHHAVHHTAKYPVAQDSLYVHPAEMIVGLVLFLGCTWIVGPVHIYSFGLIFLIYSVLNVLIHSGIDMRGPLKPFGVMARAHDKHHIDMGKGNYASITPLFDWLFRTVE